MMKTADYYLSLVKDWEDPNTAPVLREVDGVTVVRDDLLPAGSKSRFCDFLIGQNSYVNEWVYGSSPRFGYGQVSLAYICKKYKKKCTIFVAKAKELHSSSKLAQEFGANIVEVPMGFLKVTEARAKDYVNQSKGAFLVPFGIADETTYGSIIKVARKIDFEPKEVWTVAGSGVLSRGLQLAWPKANVFMVSVGHKLTSEEIGRGNVIPHYLKFQTPCKEKERPPFPSVFEYDAKAWEFVKERGSKNNKNKVLFWNVAG